MLECGHGSYQLVFHWKLKVTKRLTVSMTSGSGPPEETVSQRVLRIGVAKEGKARVLPNRDRQESGMAPIAKV